MRRTVPESSGGFVTPPSTAPNVFTAHGGRPIWWRDEKGRTHACEGAELQPGLLTYWTLCQPDLPVDGVFHPRPAFRLACEGCLAVIRRRLAIDRAASRPRRGPIH